MQTVVCSESSPKLPAGTYTGEVRDRVRHGQGKFVASDGKFTYEGEWKFDEPSGKGTYLAPDAWRTSYTGDWVAGVPCGQGTTHIADGGVIKGEFVGGKCVHGTYTYPDGVVYCGALADDRRHGAGVLRVPACGREVVGTWNYGAPVGPIIMRGDKEDCTLQGILGAKGLEGRVRVRCEKYKIDFECDYKDGAPIRNLAYWRGGVWAWFAPVATAITDKLQKLL